MVKQEKGNRNAGKEEEGVTLDQVSEKVSLA